MDYQYAFDILVGLVAFFGGWILNNITKALDRLDADMRKMPLMYVNKDDYRIDVKDIRESLQRIEEKLDQRK